MRRVLWIWMWAGLTGCAALQGMIQPPPEQVVCAKLTQTCELTPDKEAQCTEELAGWLQKHPGEKDALLTCVEGAHSCGAVNGCVVGAGIRGIGSEVSDFIKGLGKSLGL